MLRVYYRIAVTTKRRQETAESNISDDSFKYQSDILRVYLVHDPNSFASNEQNENIANESSDHTAIIHLHTQTHTHALVPTAMNYTFYLQ